MNVIDVALVEDDPTTREALRTLIDGAKEFRCIGAFGSVEEGLRELTNPPGVLLLDVNLPGMSGGDGARLFAGRFPDARILMLTVVAERRSVFLSICNGACGYLLKNISAERLIESIRHAHLGGSPMSPEVASQILSLFRKTAAPVEPVQKLTAQEIRLLGLLAEGYSYLNAAGQMGVSLNTVRDYIRRIYEKLHVHTKSEAVSKALRGGLLD